MTPTTEIDFSDRASYIGASEIAAIMNLDKWKTPLQLWEEKTGRAARFEGNQHTQRGSKLEAIAAQEYTELTGIPLFRKRKVYTHPEYNFIRGHIDRITRVDQRIIEIKCPSLASFRRMQQYGLPDNFIIQLQAYMGLTGVHKASWVIFCADAWETINFDLEFDSGLYNASIEAAARFWIDHVIEDKPPASTGDEIKEQITLAKVGGSLTIRDDDRFIGAAFRVREAKELLDDAEQIFENAKSDLLETVERTAGVYEGGGLRLYLTESAGRKTLDKDALAKAYPELDLARFEKIGKPFTTTRIYFPKGTN